MAEKKENIVAEEVAQEEATVPRAEYDKLFKEYQRVVTGFNILLNQAGDNYKKDLIKTIFEQVDQEAEKK